jgi:methylmalonyl-CoA/ethylmalonyl-CoA epimerase
VARVHIDHVALCVWDLEQAVADWSDILRVLSPEHVSGLTRGRGTGDGVTMEWATFQNPDPQGVSIQVWAPASPGSWVHKVLAKRGEFVHHICFASDDFAQTMSECRKAGLPIVLDEDSGPEEEPWMRWNFITMQKAHGTLIELGRRYLTVGDKWYPHPGNAENSELLAAMASLVK